MESRVARNSRRQGPGLFWRTAKCIVPIRPGTAASPTPLDCPVNSAFCPYPWSLLSACQQPREGHPSTCPSWKAHLLRPPPAACTYPQESGPGLTGPEICGSRLAPYESCWLVRSTLGIPHPHPVPCALPTTAWRARSWPLALHPLAQHWALCPSTSGL